jgi:hypothetical protein
MASSDIEKGRRYFCREETTGKGYSGMFHIDEDVMEAQLFAFDEALPRVFDDLLIARLEDNRIASLHQNVTNGPASHYRKAGDVRSSSMRIISNIVVIGEEPWQPEDPIRRVQFSITHADDLLHHSDKFRAIAGAEFSAMPEAMLFELAVDGMKIKVWYPATGNMSFNRPTEIGVRYELEFDEPRDLHSYLKDVQCVVRFASAALCHGFAPSEINISQLSHADFLSAVEAREGYHDHAVRYVWPVEAPENSLWVGDAFAHVRNDEHLTEFLNCLRHWVERDDNWSAATNLMMSAFKLQRTMSGERLLNACKWLEKIPGADSEVAVSKEHINAIATVAAAEAARLGHNDYGPRIAGVIRGKLKKESNAERFARLHAGICARYGNDALPSDAIPHLLKAQEYRGDVAHGYFEPEDEADYRAFEKSVYAMEALCYLLTIKDLPISDEGAKRAAGQQIVANYRHCVF